LESEVARNPDWELISAGFLEMIKKYEWATVSTRIGEPCLQRLNDHSKLSESLVSIDLSSTVLIGLVYDCGRLTTVVPDIFSAAFEDLHGIVSAPDCS